MKSKATDYPKLSGQMKRQ